MHDLLANHHWPLSAASADDGIIRDVFMLLHLLAWMPVCLSVCVATLLCQSVHMSLSVGSALHLTCLSSCWRGTVFIPAAVAMLLCYISYIQCFCYNLCCVYVRVCLYLFVCVVIGRLNFPHSLENNFIIYLTKSLTATFKSLVYYKNNGLTWLLLFA